MCLIVDTNCAAKMFSDAEEAKPIQAWLLKSRSAIAIGGTVMANEYKLMHKFLSLLATLDSGGKIRRYEDVVVDREVESLEKLKICCSNDTHIVVLARVSGARVLYSHDNDLHSDFRNRAILTPRGKVYQSANHKHLLKQAPACAL